MKNSKKRRDSIFTEEQVEQFFKYVDGDDLDFYETVLMDQPKEQQHIFFKQHPEFLSDYKLNPLKDDNAIELLRDEIFRGLMRKIKKLDGEKE